MKVEDSTLAVVRALERLKVRHDVGGSLASSIHGDPRATNDADIIAVLAASDEQQLQRELGSRFLVDSDEFRHAVNEQRSFNLIDEVELAKIDVFCVRAEGYQAEALARAVRAPLEPDDPFSEVTVASAEDRRGVSAALVRTTWRRRSPGQGEGLSAHRAPQLKYAKIRALSVAESAVPSGIAPELTSRVMLLRVACTYAWVANWLVCS